MYENTLFHQFKDKNKYISFFKRKEIGFKKKKKNVLKINKI
jgi:hypothetical protein